MVQNPAMTPVSTTPVARNGNVAHRNGHASVGQPRHHTRLESLFHELPTVYDIKHPEPYEHRNDRQEFCENLCGLDERGPGEVRVNHQGRTQESKGAEGVEPDGRKGDGDKLRVSQCNENGRQDGYRRGPNGHQERSGPYVDEHDLHGPVARCKRLHEDGKPFEGPPLPP